MSRSRPDHLDLNRLRRQARELWAAARAGRPAALNRFDSHVDERGAVGDGRPRPVTLAQAQWVIAREHGFASWSRLRAQVEARGTDLAGLVDDFLTASIEGRTLRAARLLATERRIALHDIDTAAVLGEAAAVENLIADQPELASRPDRRRGWPPLLYVCHSRWHRVDPTRTEGLLQVAWLLLDAGASANTADGARSALAGAAGLADNPAITALLLRYGADPDDGETLARAARHRDPACLRLLLDRGARAGAAALSAAVAPRNAVGVRLLLDAGADPGGSPNVLALAADTCGPDVVEPLVAAGADLNAPGADGRSPVRTATRAGNADVARLLVKRGARDDSTEVDRFLGACLRADRAAAVALLTARPDLPRLLTADDLGALGVAAARCRPAAVRLMVELGFPVAARGRDGGTALHHAARAGRPEVIELLVALGADVDAPDGRWGSSPLAWATVGSGERRRSPVPGDWLGAVRALLRAGAVTDDAWIPGYPPGEDVLALLARYGIEEPDLDEGDR